MARIELIRNLERYIKGKVNRIKINKDDFSIISNNCWGTFVYKSFGIAYNSPFVNLTIFAPDYIELLEDFSSELLNKLTFIEHEESKHKDELISLGIYKDDYPIGVLDGRIELHFLHYESKEDAREKWLRRCERINYNKLIFKFSDGDKFDESLARRFDALEFNNKVCFTSKPYNDLKSIVYLENFSGEPRVKDEWKHYKKYFDIYGFINNMHVKT